MSAFAGAWPQSCRSAYIEFHGAISPRGISGVQPLNLSAEGKLADSIVEDIFQLG